jgi:hypothetical protein
MAVNSRKASKSARAEVDYEQMFYKGEERLGYMIQRVTSGTCPVKICGERGFRLFKIT